MSEGVSDTEIPAALNAAIFSAPSPSPGDDGARVSHPLPLGGGLAGDEPYHRLGHVRLHVGGRLFLRHPADLADHDDGFGLRVGLEERRGTSMKFVPLMGSPPMPTQVDCPSPTSVTW